MRFDLRAGDTAVVVRDLSAEDEDAVLDVFTASEDWFVAETGQPSAPGDVQSLFYALPEGSAFEDKLLLVVEANGAVVGLVDAVLGYPRNGSIGVGTFLIRSEFRRRGIGGAVAQALLDAAADAGYVRIGTHVAPGWEPGRGFLEAAGFAFSEPRMPGGDTNRNPGPLHGPVIPAVLTIG
ncbi:N-acetyltransferase family protein [Amycolatopsis sp. MEPSY49]|uniref:GNAT family N-acetyltransferase n=1 Tax=Amycolatopsis sp. MEPSY49 TaxID=3151600 RepID=UPI003EF8C938